MRCSVLTPARLSSALGCSLPGLRDSESVLVELRRALVALRSFNLGVRIRVTLMDIDPLNKVPFKRAIVGVQKVPFKGSP